MCHADEVYDDLVCTPPAIVRPKRLYLTDPNHGVRHGSSNAGGRGGRTASIPGATDASPRKSNTPSSIAPGAANGTTLPLSGRGGGGDTGPNDSDANPPLLLASSLTGDGSNTRSQHLNGSSEPHQKHHPPKQSQHHQQQHQHSSHANSSVHNGASGEQQRWHHGEEAAVDNQQLPTFTRNLDGGVGGGRRGEDSDRKGHYGRDSSR